jgi:hypothetical protein
MAVQMGGGRADWYGWDWLDNSGEPSADHVVTALASLSAPPARVIRDGCQQVMGDCRHGRRAL